MTDYKNKQMDTFAKQHDYQSFKRENRGSKQKALNGARLNGARNWCDQMLVSLGGANKYLPERAVFSNKRTTGIRGVSRSIQYDKRNDTHYLVYSVHWRKAGKPHTKTFYVGRAGKVNADEEFHAFRTAVRFRREYELHKAEDAPFFPARFKQWREMRLYDPRKIS